jgi:hypothetical protein
VQAFEDDSDHIDISDLTSDTQAALSCMEKAVSDAGGTLGLQSAYRPKGYNDHLREVWHKWVDELRKNNEPACQALKAEVKKHFLNKHHLLLKQPPVPNSRHTTGQAIDARIDLPDANVDKLAASCNLKRTAKEADPVHFQYQPPKK